MQSNPATGYQRRQAYLQRIRNEGSHPLRHQAQARFRSGVDTRTNPKATAAGGGIARRRSKLAALKRPPLPPVAPLHPHQSKEPSTMNLAVTPITPEELSPEQLADLRDRLRITLEEDKNLSQARLAKESDISSATLSQFLGGTYAGNQQNVARKLAGWLNVRDERISNGKLPEGPEFVTTPTSEKLRAVLQYAHMAGDIAVIAGGAGLGKTVTNKRYAAVSPNVWHVELTPATGGVLTCLQEIAAVMGLRDLVNSAAYIQRAIFQKVRNTSGLLILDEAQHLTVQALDMVRAINDQTSIGLVLCGNDRVITQMTGGNRAPFLDRLYSRVGKRLVIHKVVKGDADAIIDAWNIADAGCRDQIRQIADLPGALRVLNKVLRLASIYSQAKNERICCESIRYAAKELGVMV
ncbi:AAA family ATPase [Stenotrophomonas sp. PSU-St15]